MAQQSRQEKLLKAGLRRGNEVALCVNECSSTFRDVGLARQKAQELPATKCLGRVCIYVLDKVKITEKQGFDLLAGLRSRLSLFHDLRSMSGAAASLLAALFQALGL